MKRTLALLTGLLLWGTGCSDQPLAPEIELDPGLVSSAVATANGITISSIDGPTDPVAVNTPVQITAHFAGASGNAHTAVIRWGDGASSVATINEVDGAGTAAGARSYVLPGVYTVEVEVSDQNAGSVIGTHEYVTVYDPDGGYVSGNGTILSPANACTWSGCVADEGTARFGFSSRYRNGATVPDGNTRFTFRDGNFTFSSTAYEWLVIAGARAQYKGQGTVNRQGNYGFMLTSIDSDRAGGGEEDRFRIKIWDRDNGDAVVYDNQAGAEDDAGLTADGTRLTSGSITVRSTTRNEAPVVIITSPTDGATILETEGVLLSADAGDAEDGDISESVVWTSDLAGELGVGAELADVSLAPGSHTITAHITDSGALEASASVVVEILEVTISVSPAEATISEGETQQFTATVYAGGVELLSGAPAVAWSSSDVGVATVDADGLATGVGVGEATVTVAIGHVMTSALLAVEVPTVPVLELMSETISAGENHSCGLDQQGKAWCWGHNTSGQLGTGTTNTEYFPRAVSMPDGVSFARISAGYANTVALTADGIAYAWGRNGIGELGDGTTTNRSTPVEVLMPDSERFVAIDPGLVHTVALTSSGAAYAWGGNYHGELGDGTTTHSTTPVLVSAPDEVRFVTVSAGIFLSVALTTTGVAYGWGRNNYGQLGNGTATSSTTPTPVAMPAGVSFIAIDAPHSSSVALTNTGTAFAWGRNEYGQLGNGTTTDSNIPVPVTLPAGVSLTAIDMGHYNALALVATGEAYAWGRNNHGQLGNGTTTDSSTPLPVSMPAGVTFTAVSAGGWHGLAITPTGIGYSWGERNAGKLGQWSPIGGGDQLVPATVADAPIFKQ